MKKYKTYHKILVIVIPLLLLVLSYAIAVFVLKYITLPPCMSYTIAGIYCPGCGMTRAVRAIVSGNIFLSMRQNILLWFGIVTAVLYYTEFSAKVFGKNLRIPFLHNMKVLYAALAFIILYSVLRNFVPIIAPI